MKRFVTNLVHAPKVLIPATVVLAVIVGALLYNVVGRPPSVALSTDPNLSNASTTIRGNAIDLSFLRAGRLASVSVHVGDAVHAGDVLATLDAADAQGALNQAKGALELAKAQYASLNVQYANAKNQQDVLVENAYRTLISSGLSAVAYNVNTGSVQSVDNKEVPQVTGTYTCDTTGSYELYPYSSAAASGYSFKLKGIEAGSGDVTFYTPQPLGSCGLFVTFPAGYLFDPTIKWVIEIPNTRSASYAANQNAYNLALATRDQVLKQLEANLGKNGSPDANIAQASIDAAEGTYEAAQAAYNNTRIVAPADGTVSFVDADLKTGQTVNANKVLITITTP